MEKSSQSPIHRSSIDSHSSALNNKRISILLFQIDQLAITASNTCSFPAIIAYYNNVEQLYINVQNILNEKIIENEIEPARRKYGLTLTAIQKQPALQNKRVLEAMLSFVKTFNFNVINGLQGMDYFFRTSTKMPKGLKNIYWMGQTGIFSTRKETKEDTKNELEG